MCDDKTFLLELSVYFNGWLLQVVPLKLPEVGTLSRRIDTPEPATPSADRLAWPIRVAIHLVGDAASAASDGDKAIDFPVPLGPQFIPWQRAERHPTSTCNTYDLTGARFAYDSGRAFVYNAEGDPFGRVEPPSPHEYPLGDDPPDESPHIVEH